MKQQFYPLVQVIEEDYEIPQLGRHRRISALLPHDYEESDQVYSVLYLNDGQNLFDPHAPYGSWAIDKSLELLASRGLKDVIIITIDHGGGDRISEYLPYGTERFGDGEGELYLEFIEKTLKPYVDKKYRVHTGREHTGIGGSSMGGLISLYAGMAHPHVFGKMMIFSPSLWITEEIFDLAKAWQPEEETYLYLYAGQKESAEHFPNVRKLFIIFDQFAKFNEHFRLKLSIDPSGTHSEAFWRKEFSKALAWLYF